MKNFLNKNEYNLNNASNNNHDSKKQLQQQQLHHAKLNNTLIQSPSLSTIPLSSSSSSLSLTYAVSQNNNSKHNNSHKPQSISSQQQQQIKQISINNNHESKHSSSIKTNDNNNYHYQPPQQTKVLTTDSRQSSAKSISNHNQFDSHHQLKSPLKQNNNSQHDLRHSVDNHQLKQHVNDYKQTTIKNNDHHSQQQKQQISSKTPDIVSHHQQLHQIQQKQQSSIKNPDHQQPLSSTKSKLPNDSKQQTVNTRPISNNLTNNKNTKLINLITNSNDEVAIFDPEPAYEVEGLPFNRTMILDDKSFIIDDDELDNEISLINSKSSDRISNSSRDSVHIVNEVPEGRLSKKSSRSSQSSVCSNSTRESSNILADFSDSISYNTDPNGDSMCDSEADGYRNELLETLVKKFNIHIDDSSNKGRNLSKNSSDLQKKIQRTQLNKFESGSESEANSKRKQFSRSNSEYLKRNLKLRDIKVNCLPQTFQCKYLGKIRCEGLWGVRYTREPIERLVSAAKFLKSIDDLPSMEALISEQGIYMVQKQNTKSKALEKIYRSGLVPIGNISYGVQDNKYGKIFSCIVVRERDSKTLCECYAFLNSKAEYARRMALSLTLAFKEYGKLLQIKESKIRHSIELAEVNDGMGKDSVA